MSLLEGPHVLHALEELVCLGDAQHHVSEHAARNEGLDAALGEGRGARARVQVIVGSREDLGGGHQVESAVLAPHLKLAIQGVALGGHAGVFDVGLEGRCLLAVLGQASHERQRGVGENTDDVGVFGGNGNVVVCHDSSIVPDGAA